jgi:hypothetical protein
VLQFGRYAGSDEWLLSWRARTVTKPRETRLQTSRDVAAKRAAAFAVVQLARQRAAERARSLGSIADAAATAAAIAAEGEELRTPAGRRTAAEALAELHRLLNLSMSCGGSMPPSAAACSDHNALNDAPPSGDGISTPSGLLPPSQDPSISAHPADWRVELIAGRNLELDCNRVTFSGRMRSQPVAGTELRVVQISQV